LKKNPDALYIIVLTFQYAQNVEYMPMEIWGQWGGGDSAVQV